MYTVYRWVNRSYAAMLLLGLWLYPVIAYAQKPGSGDMHPWGWNMMWGGWGMSMMLMMMLFWAAIIVAIVFLIRWLVTTRHSGQHTVATQYGESALDILKKRYARGEINKQEFEDMCQDIQ